MKSIADRLPPEIARQIHPDRRKNEAAYWAVRDQLLDQFRGQWIGFADGAVIASGSSPVTVFHAAEASGATPLLHLRWTGGRAMPHPSRNFPVRCGVCRR